MSSMVETLKRSLTLSRDLLYRHTTCSEELAKVEQLLSLLSDRSALLWALLEEEAKERVEITSGLPSGNVATFGTYGKGGACSFRDGAGRYLTRASFPDWMTPSRVREHILNLARAIEGQEVSGG